MIKTRSKKVSLLLVLMMLATLFVGVGPASAACSYSVLSTPTVLNNGVTPGPALATVQIDVPQVTAATHTALVTLPKDFVIDGTQAAGVNIFAAATSPALSFVKDGAGHASFAAAGITPLAVGVGGADANAGIVRMSDREFKITYTAASAVYDLRMLLTFPRVTIPDSADGDITATVTSLAGSAFSSGSVVIGKAGSGEVSAYTSNTATFSDTGCANGDIEINLKENTQFAIKGTDSATESESVKIRLPKGFSWKAGATIANITTGAAIPTVAAPAASVAAGVKELTVGVDAADSRNLLVARNDDISVKSIFRISAGIDVDDTVAVLGDVNVDISGASTVTTGSLLVGTYTSYGVTAKVVESVPQIYAGQMAQEVADFNIEENSKASIVANRAITLTLPSGAKWQTVNAPTCTGSLAVASGPALVTSSNGKTIKLSCTNAGATKGKLEFKNVEIVTACDFTGDVAVEIEGGGLEATKLTIATVQPAISGTATSNDVKIGVQSQDAGTITLVESVKETLINGQDLNVVLPVGIDWAAIPTVTVKDGDLDLDDNAINTSGATATVGATLAIPIKSQSSKASTIEISNIKLTVDRTVPEGKIKFKIQGAAVDEVNNLTASVASGGIYGLLSTNSDGQIFARNTDAAVVYGANCVTPAPGQTANETVLTLGAATYKINGVDKTASVAPYAENNRTYCSIRDVSYALGITEDNIVWNQENQTVTLIKDGKFVQLKLGSTEMLVGGVTISMDVAVSAKDNFTTLPASWVAKAFGQTATFDAATNTVTIK